MRRADPNQGGAQSIGLIPLTARVGHEKCHYRQPDPVEEIVKLEDYRARYNQYRRDADLQELHKSTPFIWVWDDHELANDTYKDGAENHTEGEAKRRGVGDQNSVPRGMHGRAGENSENRPLWFWQDLRPAF